MKLMYWCSIIALTCYAVVTFLIRKKPTSKLSQEEKKENEKEKVKEQEEEKEEKKKDDCYNDYEIPELSSPKWIKVGCIERLHIYPLHLGSKTSCSMLQLAQYGISTKRKGLILWDKLNVSNIRQAYQTTPKPRRSARRGGDTYKCAKTRQSALLRYKNALFNHKYIRNQSIAKKIKLKANNTGTAIKYIDCGDVAADWVNEYFQTTTLRLVQAIYKDEDKSEKKIWKLWIDTLYRNFRQKIWTETLDTASKLRTCYVMITSLSMKELENSVSSKIQSHIIISAPTFSAFAEKNWRWIKISNVLIKRYMPGSDLKSNKELWEKDYCNSPWFMGTFYELHNAGGEINVNDDVFIYNTELDPEISENDSSNNTMLRTELYL